MATTCFICQKSINGDAAYFSHHLNRCLDSQSQSEPAHPTPGLLTAEEADALVAQSLADELAEEASRDLILAISRGDDNEHEREGGGCPVCLQSWEELGTGSGEEERVRHAGACLEFGGVEMGEEEEEEMGRGGFGRMVGSTNVKEKGRSNGWDQVQGVQDIIPVMELLLSRSHSMGRTREAYLCNPLTEHIETQFKDWGWGCGYRNAQMIFSSLRKLPCYSDLAEPGSELHSIPTIGDFQILIEEAWRQGYDPSARDHFNGRLKGVRKWIGTTEIYVALTFLGVRARIIDFPKVPGAQDGTHTALVRWITDYFSSPNPSSASPKTLKRNLSISDSDSDDKGKGKEKQTESKGAANGLAELMESRGTAVHVTKKQPLYLQHDGHSRTVVGVDRGKDGDWLLIFDPAKSTNATMRKSAATYRSQKKQPPPSHKRLKPTSSPPSSSVSSSSSSDEPNLATTSSSTKLSPATSVLAKLKPKIATAAFWENKPGFERIWTGKSTTGEGGSGNNEVGGSGGREHVIDVDGYAKHLANYRVGLKSLSRKQEYQILFVEEGPVLTHGEKASRRLPKSTVVTR